MLFKVKSIPIQYYITYFKSHFQNFDALLLQILVLTLFCPSSERSVDDGPVLNNEAAGRPKLSDLFTPEFCLKVGDTFINSIKNESGTPVGSIPLTQWLQRQRNGTPGAANPNPDAPLNNHSPENLSHLVSGLIESGKNPNLE